MVRYMVYGCLWSSIWKWESKQNLDLTPYGHRLMTIPKNPRTPFVDSVSKGKLEKPQSLPYLVVHSTSKVGYNPSSKWAK